MPIEIEAEGLDEAVEKLKRISYFLLDEVTEGMFEAGQIIRDKLSEVTEREYTVEVFPESHEVWIVPDIEEFEIEREKEKREITYMFRTFRCPYWKYMQPKIKIGWPTKEDIENIILEVLSRIEDIIYRRVRRLVEEA